MEKTRRTLDEVLRSIGIPGITVQALLGDSPSPPASWTILPQQSNQQSGSPKLHSLPDNSLDPLRPLAEASLANRRAQAVNQSETST